MKNFKTTAQKRAQLNTRQTPIFFRHPSHFYSALNIGAHSSKSILHFRYHLEKRSTTNFTDSIMNARYFNRFPAGNMSFPVNSVVFLLGLAPVKTEHL